MNIVLRHPVVRHFSIRNVEVIWVSPFWASVSVSWLWCCSYTPAMPSAYAIIRRGKWPLHHRPSSRIALLALLPPVDARRRGSRARHHVTDSCQQHRSETTCRACVVARRGERVGGGRRETRKDWIREGWRGIAEC